MMGGILSSGITHFLAHLLSQDHTDLVDQLRCLDKFGHGYLRCTIGDGGINILQGVKPCRRSLGPT